VSRPETPDSCSGTANGGILTRDETLAIRALARLARKWPPSLTLFSWSGSLFVVRSGSSLLDAEDPETLILAEIEGIPNDGGDP
jgi:hypothetical protein